ncbi:hypothetical protein [Phenylobacterium sp.]|uniref:hypothetical protein n=1 Tax=Phenylobacterium sp. TaxID=1871053 RepID=UPI003983D91C
MPADFQPVYADLRDMMLRAASGMVVAKDAPGGLVMHAPGPNPGKPKDPVWFGMVKLGKAYVSYHLMPLYTDPGLLAQVPAGLEKHKQGKTCFNFKAAEPHRFAELEVLTRACALACAQPPTTV